MSDLGGIVPDMTSPARPAIEDFATWVPLLRLLREANAETLDAPGGLVSGYIGDGASSVPLRVPDPSRLGRALQVSDTQENHDAIRKVNAARVASGLDGIGFKAEISSSGHCGVWFFSSPPSTGASVGVGNYPGTIVRYEGALPEPARRMPVLYPEARPHPSADPVLLERLVRQRFPHAVGARDEELAAAEDRLGRPLPAELEILYRVVGQPRLSAGDYTWEEFEDDGGEPEERELTGAMLSDFLLSVHEVSVKLGDFLFRERSWHLASEVAITPPGASVQQLVDSPGWVVFGDDHAGAVYAVDLTPGPCGHVGQVIGIPDDESIGAWLVAHSLTDFIQGKSVRDDISHGTEGSAIARVNIRGIASIEAAAHPDLEVLSLGVWENEPMSLAPVIGLPKLRTLCAYPGTLADPLEVAQLANLEYLELGPKDWRILLDAKAIPRSLLAAHIKFCGNPIPHPQPDPLDYIALANEILALWNGPQISVTVIEGQL